MQMNNENINLSVTTELQLVISVQQILLQKQGFSLTL